MARSFDHLLLKASGTWNRVEQLFEKEHAPAQKARTLEPGHTVAGRYRLESLLGEGGMGRVWLAQDLVEKRQVALKQMRTASGPGAPAATASEGEDLAFKREFYTMTKLQHPNTVSVFDAGLLENHERYIAMEVVHGQDLDHLLSKGQLPLRQVYRILSDMALVLGFIHSRLYVHCDIKAENIRISSEGQLKLMDFGLMHQLGTPTGGTLKGTVFYMAPEMAKGGIIDARTDLYSLGVLAFLLITGKLPFVGRSASEILTQHLEKPPPRVLAFRDVPKPLDEWVARLLSKEPRDRFQDAGELLSSLGRLAGKALEIPRYSARTSYLSAAELVGRKAEQEQLKEAFSGLLAGNGHSVFVTAPAGVGKTRLLQEFRLSVKLADVPFLVGQCRAEGQMPLAALVEALSLLVPLSSPEVLGRYHAELAQLLPALAEPGKPTTFGKNLTEEERKAHLFTSVSQWLQEIARERPFVLCLEDLHWADFGTLEWMNVVVRALQGTRAMLLGTFRTDEVDRLSIAFQTIDEGVARRIELPPLTQDSTVDLLGQMLRGFQPPADFGARVFESTKGNAFFVTETLRALIEKETLKLEEGAWTLGAGPAPLELPSSIKDVVRQRLLALEPRAYELCQRLAPVGRLLDLRVVKNVCDIPDEELFQRLDELVERQFLQRLEGDFYFVHDKVREGAYQTLDAATRAATHERIGQTLERLRKKMTSVTPALLGHHFAQGQSPDKAVSYLIEASRRAADESRALLEAARLLSQATDLLENHHPAQKERLVTLWAELVEQGFVASPPICMKYGEKLLAQWESTFDIPAGFVSFNEETRRLRAGSGFFKKRRLRQLWQERPLEAGNPKPLHWVPRYYTYRGMLAFTYAVAGQVQRSMELLGKQLADNPEPGAYRAGTQIYTSIPLMRMGQWARQQREARECIEWFEAHMREVGVMPVRLHWSRSIAYYSLAMGQSFMGLPVDEAALAQGHDIAQTYQFDDIFFFLDIARMVRAGAVGEPAPFQQLYHQIAERVRRLGNPRLLETRLVLNLPGFFLSRRDFDRTAAVVERLETLSQLSTDAWLRRNTLAHRALLSVEQQDWKRAAPELESALKAGGEVPSFAFNVPLLCAQGKSLLHEGKGPEARVASEKALKLAEQEATANPLDQAMARRFHGQLLGKEAGLNLIEESLKVARQNQLRVQEAVAHLAFAETAQTLFRERAAEHLAQAQALFTELECPTWLQEVTDLRLRAGGVGTGKGQKWH